MKTFFFSLISVLFAYHAFASSRSVAGFTKPSNEDTTLRAFVTLASGNADVKKPGFFSKVKTKLIKLIAGKEVAMQPAENWKAKKTKWGLIIVLFLIVGGLAALIIALGSMNFH